MIRSIKEHKGQQKLGVDLTLLPVSYELSSGELICDHAFNLDLNAVVQLLWDVPSRSTDAVVYWPIASIPEDLLDHLPPLPYRGGPQENFIFGRAEGANHRYVLARDIKHLWETRRDVLDEANDFERAAFAFISHLDEETKVFVYSW